jgi:ribosomal protein S18 acetylase RimI-like enzyme
MTENFIIKVIPPKDSLVYRSLRLQSIKEEPSAFGSNHDEQFALEELFFEAKIKQEASGFFVVGCYSLDCAALYGICAASITGESVEIFQMYVECSKRNIGIAKKLLNFLLGVAQERSQVKSVVLDVFSTNKNALDFYVRNGFATIKEGSIVHMERNLKRKF